jgi:signal transduction histidine kinase
MALEASGAGVFEFTMPLGADTHYDPRWASLLGYAPEDLPLDDRLGTWLVDRLEPDNRPSALQTFERFIARRVERLDFELRVRHREGHLLHVGVSADATERDERGRATQVVGVMLNLTERRRLEAQFRQSQKMEAIGRLAGGVAHDVNNLLSVILTSGEFALLEIDEQHVARDDVQEMLNAAGRISALTEQLLAFSRSKPVTPRVLNINTVVAEIDRLLRRLVGKEVEMSTLMADDLWNVRIDLGSLEQVITNLVVNARDAMAQGGRLIVATSNVSIAPGHRLGPEVELAAGEYVTLAVSDEGVGMDEQTRRKIFEPFFTTKEPGKGTGLGLATCYGIAKQAGGYIGVESEPASGTTFTVYFPRVAETSDQPAAREDRTGTTLRGSESILVVEDDDLVRRTVVRILTGLGYHVTAVASGAQALTEYERGTPVDVLLTDMMLPDMTGDQVIEQVRAGRPGVKVVRMSGYTPSVTIRQGRELADVPVLRKPFTPEQMGRSIRGVLDG